MQNLGEQKRAAFASVPTTTSSTTTKLSQQEHIRQLYVSQQIKARYKEFTDLKNLTLFIGTWNVNAQKPSQELKSWLAAEQAVQSLGGAPDIYVLGFQEIVDLNATNLVVDHQVSQVWETALKANFSEAYVKVATKHLVGLSMCVFVKEALAPHVHHVASEHCGVGIMGVGGNKGAVAVTLSIFDTSFCFVNCHLAAHKHNVAGRNGDFHSICGRMRFPDTQGKSKSLNSATTGGELSVFDYDMLFWLGDLNYRLNREDLDGCYTLIDNKAYQTLLKADQLMIEKKKRNCFKGFKEGKIDFAPTYKYIAGTDQYDRRPDKKKRFPAWCDRVQWIGADSQISQTFYGRSEHKLSDHKPVIACFQLEVHSILQEQKKLVCADVNRLLDKSENDAIPKIKLEPTQVDFLPGVYFNKSMTKQVTVTNIGTVMATFFFVNLGQQSGFNVRWKPWLGVSQQYGMIAPGDTAVIELTVDVTKEHAHDLNIGKDQIMENLVLRLENGPDYFITVSGEYRKSCFGASIEYLVQTPGPVRFAEDDSKTTAAVLQSKSSRAQKKFLRLPKEVWRMVDYLFKHGMQNKSIFRDVGITDEVETLKECLDTGAEFPGDVSVHSVAQTLIVFFENLKEPVFPTGLTEQYNDSIDLADWVEESLNHLSPAHYNVFMYLVAFLRELLKHSAANGLSANQLVLIFAGCLMACLGMSEDSVKPKAWIILKHLLVRDQQFV